MPRTEQFAFGVAVIGAALAVLLKSDLWAWIALVLGFVLICEPYVQDMMWGTERPTRYQIQKMPAEEYKNRVLNDRKLERWVNHIESKSHSKSVWKLTAPLALLFILGATVAWEKRNPEKPAASDQWMLERYSADKGYTFARNGVKYQARCWATELHGPESRILVNDADVCVTVMLPYIRKSVPLEQAASRTMTTSPDMLYFTESKTGLKYVFRIMEAN